MPSSQTPQTQADIAADRISFYKAARTRAAARERVLTGLPLEDVDMAVPVGIGDFIGNSIWPPQRISKKVNRLLTYDRLYRGDITDFVEDRTAANNVPNFFERVPTVISALMLSADPVVPPEELLPMQTYLGACILDGFKTGRGYLVRAGENVWSPDTSSVYDGAEGEIYIVSVGTSLDAQNSDPDYADIWRVDEQSAIKWRQAYDVGQFGEVIIPPAAVPGTYAVADRPPSNGGWGKSMYDSLIAPVVGMALRISGNERIIEKNLHPITTFGVSISDLSMFGSQGSQVQRGKTEPDMAAFQKIMTDAIDEDLLLIPTGSELSKLEWGAGAMAAAEVRVEKFRDDIAAMSGIPLDVLNGSMEAASGVAIDKWLLALYAETRMFFNVVKAAAEKVRGAPFEWPNYFEQGRQEAVEPAPSMMIGVADAEVPSLPA